MDGQAVLRLARNNPVALSRLLWETEPLFDYQEEILEAVWGNKYVAVRSCNGAGKSLLAARTTLLFLLAWPDSKVITTAPTYRQVREVLWGELSRQYHTSKYPIGGELTTTELRLGDGWVALGLSTDDQSRFLGHHAENILIVQDESGGISNDIDEACRSLMTSQGSKLLKIGNPIEPSGHFYDAFLESSPFKKIHISAYRTPNVKAGKVIYPRLVTKDWMDERIAEYGKDSPWVQCYVHGEFPQQGSDNLIPLSDVLAAVNKKVAPSPYMAFGCDVARYGDDFSVIFLYDRGTAKLLSNSNGKSTMETAGQLLSYYESQRCVISIDDVGVGGGVSDRLIEQIKDKTHIFRFIANERAVRPDKYANRTAEAWCYLRDELKAGALSIPEDEELKAQLIGRKYYFKSNGTIELESKDEMKRRGLRSPDKADALAMAVYAAKLTYRPPAQLEVGEISHKRAARYTGGF